jgi:hypothetical protein
MCEPISLTTGLLIGGLVIAAAGMTAQAVSTAQNQQQQAKAAEQRNNAQKEMYAAQGRANDLARTNAIIGDSQRNAQITQQQIQERDSATMDVMKNNLKATEARSTSQAALGAAGVSGVSVDSLMSSIGSSQGRYNASVGENLRSQGAGHDWDRVNSYNEMASTINGSNSNYVNAYKAPEYVQQPNYAGIGLQLGAGLAGAGIKGAQDGAFGNLSGSKATVNFGGNTGGGRDLWPS